MHYRVGGEDMWHRGGVLNMSSTGILFRGGVTVRKGTRIEVSIELPCVHATTRGATINATGVVMRSHDGEPTGQGVVLAAQLVSLRIRRP